MASTVDIYTTGNMEKVVIANSPSEATGFPIENAFDNNPDTYWKPTSSSSVDIEMDFGSNIISNALVLLIKDYDTDYDAASCVIALQESTDGINWTQTVITATNIVNDTGSPVYIYDFSPVERQYWRLQIGAGSNVPELSGIFLCKKHTVPQGNQWPENDADTFIGNHRDAVINFSRNYLINGTAYHDTLRNVFLDSRRGETFYPVILQEGTNDSEAIMCRFANTNFNRGQFDYQLHNITIDFIGTPFIHAGELY